MALKAGRVGVAPDQVDDFGKISSAATSGYTKQEADAKFETQTHAASTYETQSHAASTYETKSEASTALAAKQSIQLEVPIHMMDGTKLTVESALDGLKYSESAVTDVVEGATIVTAGMGNHLRKIGNLVELMFEAENVAVTAWTDNLFTIPEGYRPITNIFVENKATNSDTLFIAEIFTNGSCLLSKTLSNGYIRFLAHWFTN